MSDTTPQPIPVQYWSSTGPDRHPATATFEARAIVVRLANGGERLDLPYDGFQVTGGGAAGGTVIVTVATGATTYARLYFEGGGWAGKLGDRMPESALKQLKVLGRTAGLRRHPVLWVGGSLALVGALGWFATFGALDLAIDATPPAWEIKLGQAFAENTGKQRCSDPVVTEAIATITEKLVAELPADQPYPFRFTVIWDDQQNAFALPGGQVMITTGLIAKAQSPDEVAGVLGHEIQHVLGRHSFRRLAKELGLGVVATVMLGDVSGATAVVIGKNLVGLKFDRDQESESDRVGVKLAYEAGYRPEAIGDFFKRLQAEQKVSESEAQLAALLSTHPAHGERLAEIARIAAALPKREPVETDLAKRWDDVRKRAGALPAKTK